MTPRTTLMLCLAVVATACSGGSDDDTSTARIDDQVVIDPELVAEARDRAENADDLEVATAPTTSTAPATDAGDGSETGEGPSTDGGAPPATTEPEIEVAEADEDELDGLLNSLTVFTNCLADDGFEFIGAPGIGGETADQFDQPYLESLGRCATASNVLESIQDFGSAQENRTPDEIAQFNFGLPVFRECLIGLGWTVGELVPDADGALTFAEGLAGGLQAPSEADGFGTDDISTCRLEAEQYVADNYEAGT